MSELRISTTPHKTKKKEKQEIRVRVRLDGVLYDDPPDWFKKHVGNVISNVLCG